eukprot:COSAG01_NODE_22408_length_857_cov_1.055409_1_plen_202_part_10
MYAAVLTGIHLCAACTGREITEWKRPAQLTKTRPGQGSYLTYLRHTKTSNPTALPRINFFCACIAELFGLDMGLAYEQAFLSIRQLAVTLRNALTGKARAAGAQGGAASSAVCCWPFVNALRCWGQVLARYPRESELGLLVYPYTQTVRQSGELLSRRGRSLSANASGLDTHRDSISSRSGCSASGRSSWRRPRPPHRCACC